MSAKNLLFITALAFAASCQSGGYFQTSETLAPSDDLKERLLKDTVVTIQNNFLPAKSRLYFPHGQEKIAVALEAELRKRGYAVGVDKLGHKPGDLQLAYKFSENEVGLYVLRVSVGEAFQINRLYKKDEAGEFLEAGPLLIRREEKL